MVDEILERDIKRVIRLSTQLKDKIIEDRDYESIKDKVDFWKVILRSQVKFTKLTSKSILDYEKCYNLKLPIFLIHILTEVGDSTLIGHNFIENGEIWNPTYFMEDAFFIGCIENGVSVEVLDDFQTFFDPLNNTFSHQGIDEVYTTLGCDDNLLMSKLLYIGHGEEYLILNTSEHGSIASVGGGAVKSITINDLVYEKYYYVPINVTFRDFFFINLRSKVEYIRSLEEILLFWLFVKNYGQAHY